MGFSLKRAATAAVTGGASEVVRSGKFKDLLFGKKAGGAAADPIAAEILALRSKGLKSLTEEFKQDPSKIIAAQTARQTAGLEGAREDARRRTQELVARRGLSGTSAGLSQQLGTDRGINQQIAQLRASTPERIQQFRQERAGRALAATSGAPVRFRPTAARRGGGISGILGTAIGGAFGGPSGAKIGLGVGQAAGGAFG